MSERLKAPAYVIDAFSPIPRQWYDHHGPIRVMTPEPIAGYIMAKRPGAAPFVLRVAELLNAKPHPNLGPFVLGREPKP